MNNCDVPWFCDILCMFASWGLRTFTQTWAGWWARATPLKNRSSSIGMISNPIDGKIKLMFQTTNHSFMWGIYPIGSVCMLYMDPHWPWIYVELNILRIITSIYVVELLLQLYFELYFDLPWCFHIFWRPCLPWWLMATKPPTNGGASASPSRLRCPWRRQLLGSPRSVVFRQFSLENSLPKSEKHWNRAKNYIIPDTCTE